MTITIELKPETEKRLAEKAKKKGLPIETFIEVFIEDNLKEEQPEKEKPFHETATREEWIAEFDKWVDSHRTDTPLLSDEATRRENIYEDRF
jgi:hypothetical protein